MDLLVETDWLQQHRDNPQIRIVEAPWKDDGYAKAHIEGALKLPWHSYLKAETDDGDRSHHLISQDDFLQIANELGLRQDDHVVAYDEYHGLFATRLSWIFNYYGFSNVSVLNGGWQQWVEKSLPVSVKIEESNKGSDLAAEPQEDRNIRLGELKSRLDDGDLRIWDARRREEFVGTEETSNQRNGHIPGATNLNWTDLLQDAEHEGGPRRLKPLDELRNLVQDAGFRREATVVCHCQASIRGAFASFVLEMLGYPKNRVYDAAMAEWANRDDTPLQS